MATVRVRPAVAEDRDRLLEMGFAFYAQTPYARLSRAPQAVLSSLGALIDQLLSPPHVLIVAETVEDDLPLKVVGMIALLVSGHVFDQTIRFAHEVAWWVEPDDRKGGAGRMLLDAAEHAAREVDCAGVQMLLLQSSPEAAAKVYANAGYVPSEIALTKVFQ